MKLIDDFFFDFSLLETNDFQEKYQEFIKISKYFSKYLLLTHFQEKFVEFKPLTIYCNRYYCFVNFYKDYRNLFGEDEGIKQQEFKIIEQAELFSDIEWDVMEKISNTNFKF
jgi:hypothetical protein